MAGVEARGVGVVSFVFAASAPIYVFGIPVTGVMLWLVGRAIYSANESHKQKQAEKASAMHFPLPVLPQQQASPTTSTRSVVCTRCQHNFAVGPGATSAVCPNCSATLPV
jgi:hypothetical protein